MPLSECRSLCTAPYAGLNIHVATELAVPALDQTLCFSCPHYSDTLTKNNKAKNKEERAKSGPGKSSLQTSWHWETEGIQKLHTFMRCFELAVASVFTWLLVHQSLYSGDTAEEQTSLLHTNCEHLTLLQTVFQSALVKMDIPTLRLLLRSSGK